MGNDRCSSKAGVDSHVRHSEKAYAAEAIGYGLGVLEELYLSRDTEERDDFNRDMQQSLDSSSMDKNIDFGTADSVRLICLVCRPEDN